MKTNPSLKCAAIAALLLAAPVTQATTWSDTFVGYRYGADFREPNNSSDVRKNSLQLAHANGYALGQNFLSLTVLQSDGKDPANGSTDGATEYYGLYRHQLYLGKLFDRSLAFGPVKEVALTTGFDLNTKDTRLAPRKRLLVAGPTLKFDVPGFLDVSLLAAKEWNHCGLGAPACPQGDVAFDTQWMLHAAWSIPGRLGSVPLKFQGTFTYNSKKGKDYANLDSAPETVARPALMVDVGQLLGNRKDGLLMGVGYEYWHNKFGTRNDARGNKRQGIETTAPTLQLEWHF